MPAGPVSPLLTPPCGWARESNNLGLGWVVEACTSTPHQIQFSFNTTFTKVYFGDQELLYLWKEWHFSLYYPLCMFPIGQNQKEQESWIATQTFNSWEFLETRFWKYSLLTLEWHQVRKTILTARWDLRDGILKEWSFVPCFITITCFLYTYQVNNALVWGTWQAKVKNCELNSMWLPNTASYFVPKRLVSVLGLFCKTINLYPIQSLLTNINSCPPSDSPSYPLPSFLIEEEDEDWHIVSLILGVRKKAGKQYVGKAHGVDFANIFLPQ